ncbi:hypothetical protein [Plasmodium yoelii yoelii]|uniref:Uncharacterized protein n=1 Tax=Plasmodium yoelii yoelii TaxID=73239 RepID=Q7RSY9_PLAYO|nr:hypothetical protein [Plasmodium yoelii yoelii]
MILTFFEVLIVVTILFLYFTFVSKLISINKNRFILLNLFPKE